MIRKIYVYTFYRFKTLKNIKSIKSKLDILTSNKIIYGTVLIAEEGINGTISGTKIDLDEFIINLKRLLKIRKIPIKISKNQYIPFYRLKIRLKKEIVTIGNKSIKPEKISGNYISPKDWDKIINNKDYLVIDTRNNYETKIGTFKNSINPNTSSFREFPKFVENNKINKYKKIAMFCTGGIRCEKATSYLKDKGHNNVFHLEGGILKYLEKVKDNNSWKGECFVFDNRISLKHGLKIGSYSMCSGCRKPISLKDKRSKKFEEGVSCINCYDSLTETQKSRFRMRQSQIYKAKQSGKKYIFQKEFK